MSVPKALFVVIATVFLSLVTAVTFLPYLIFEWAGIGIAKMEEWIDDLDEE